jgi:hypothetical protein
MSSNNISHFPISSVNFNHHQRRINRRNRQRIRSLILRKRALINNINTLELIAQLPVQITNDPFADKLFNGSHFY